ncbi:MAG: S-methyl-5-thioribose-1-phosphate isomerase [Planctomycetota bacterium]|nr:S-methyl-5-thioribose-1-phosphate isomerase [Planctomycetota bacterium]
MTSAVDDLSPVSWVGDIDRATVRILDQTRLPEAICYRDTDTIGALRDAILDLAVRGAPAIGIAAAYGIAMEAGRVAFAIAPASPSEALEAALNDADHQLRSSRPTAVNLMWALNRLQDCFDRHSGLLSAREMAARLLMEARRIHREDRELCQRIAAAGAALLPASGGVYTHCNTGCLATGGWGTAIACLRQAHANGASFHIFAGETRPLLQGARLTAWELQQLGLPVSLCTDSMAGHLMQQGKVNAVIVGADRITARGDTANKIGTYGLAVLAKHHGIPFYVAAPYSTFDLSLTDGAAIPIEQRDPDEVRRPRGAVFAPADIPVENPAFDVTPGELITAIITERGVVSPVCEASVRRLMTDSSSEPAV